MGGWGELYPSFFWNFFNFAKLIALNNNGQDRPTIIDDGLEM